MKKIIFISIVLLIICGIAFADHSSGAVKKYYAVVNQDNVEFEPLNTNHEYDHNIILNSGDIVYCIIEVDELFKNYNTEELVWCSLVKSEYYENTGYIKKEFLTKIDSSDYTFHYDLPEKYIVTGENGANIYEKPDKNSKIIGHLDKDFVFFNNTRVLSDDTGGFSGILYKDGYISNDDLGPAQHDFELMFTTEGMIFEDLKIKDIFIPKNTKIKIECWIDKDEMSNDNEFETYKFMNDDIIFNDDSSEKYSADDYRLFYNSLFYPYYYSESGPSRFLDENIKQIIFVNKADQFSLFEEPNEDSKALAEIRSGDTMNVLYKTNVNYLYEWSTPQSGWFNVEFGDLNGFIKLNNVFELENEYSDLSLEEVTIYYDIMPQEEITRTPKSTTTVEASETNKVVEEKTEEQVANKGLTGEQQKEQDNKPFQTVNNHLKAKSPLNNASIAIIASCVTSIIVIALIIILNKKK